MCFVSNAPWIKRPWGGWSYCLLTWKYALFLACLRCGTYSSLISMLKPWGWRLQQWKCILLVVTAISPFEYDHHRFSLHGFVHVQNASLRRHAWLICLGFVQECVSIVVCVTWVGLAYAFKSACLLNIPRLVWFWLVFSE